ncbi:BamA/TamA family outer membrane protein [Pseudoalteromonas sp. SSDWG2]|uniref:BamA/TamA family outer membrane protein n=1 Tax=Pseudoalteromonas sp. SSDWG2 TaxID=3139391 RepID=UPI003BA9F01E
MKQLLVSIGILTIAMGQAYAAGSGCINPTQANQEQSLLSRQLTDTQPLPEADTTSYIRSIRFVQNNIFDTDKPEENNWLFRLANDMHIMTDQQVLQNILLFAQEDPYNPELLRESERLLREQEYLYDARIYAFKYCDGSVDVTVETKELWTLLPEISFSRSGGDNRSTIGFRDSNFLGWGKRISLARTNDGDRTGYEFIYADPNVLGSRYRSRIEYADNDDGERHWVSLSYPFFSLATPTSYGFSNGSNRRVERLYDKGEEISEFSQHTTQSSLFYGRSSSPADDWTRRIVVGYHYQKERFYELDNTNLPLAKQRVFSYPYVSVNWLQDEYVKVHNIDSITRTEDLNLGWQINTLLGYSPESLSDDISRYIIKLNVSRSHYINQNSLWRWQVGINGAVLEQDLKAENLMLSTQAEYFYNSDSDESWYVKVNLDGAQGLTADKQLTLGGDTGLRGYPSDYQQGDRRALVSIEKRYYWEYNLWQLFRVGGAAFYDGGQAWQNSNDSSTHFRQNVGLGLRLAPSRANAGTVIHFDVARPINRPDDVDSLQWLITVKNSF